MSGHKKLILGAVGFGFVALAIAAYQFETRYEMGEVSFPWQKERRRLITAHAMLEGKMGSGGYFAKFVFPKTDEEREEQERHRAQIQENCGRIAAAWRDYVVRCVEPKPADRDRISAEMTDLVGKAVHDRVAGCNGNGDADPGTEEDRAACLQFFASDTCEIFDYGRDELALGLVELMVMKPRKPQPHMKACPFIFY